MKRILLFITFCISLIGCNDQQDVLIDDGQKDSISSLRADFETQTGYNNLDKYFLMPSFKTEVNWDKIIRKGNDTLYVKVNVLDTVQLFVGTKLVDIENKVWVRAVRKSDSKTSYSLLIFAPVDSAKTFNGLIVSKSLSNDKIALGYFTKSARVTKSNYLRNESDQSDIKTSASSKIRAAGSGGGGSGGCITGTVNGVPNRTTCPSSDPDMGEGGWPDGGNDYTPDPSEYYNTEAPAGSGPSQAPPKTAEEFEEEIDDSNLPDCMGKVLDTLKTLKGNSVANIIQKFAGELPKYKLKFAQEFVGGDAGLGQVAWVRNEIKDGYVTINFNTYRDVLQNTTDLAAATTLLHESVHAYLYAFYKDDPTSATATYPELFKKYIFKKSGINSSETQHNEMAKTFINDIAASLTQYGKKMKFPMNDSFYKDLAWKGLTDTDAFKSLSDTDKKRITDIIKAEQYGIKNITPKGKKLGC